jgi:CBS-domain-containing membrane protein
MATLRDLGLVDVSVARGATFGAAAASLQSVGISALAVVDGRRHVVGLFTDDDLLHGLFPPYLAELRHTAFVRDDEDALARRAREVAGEPVARHMRKPVILAADTSLTHAAERFLHVPWGALAVVDEHDRFLGMLSQIEFARAVLERVGGIDA